MKTARQLLISPLLFFGTAFLLAPTLNLVVMAGQPSVQQPQGLLPASSSSGQAAEDSKLTLVGCDSSCCASGTNSCCGDCCEAVCYPKRVEKEVKKHCWKVESKIVCIPKFRWPWERCSSSCNSGCDGGSECKRECCAPLCGRTRCINVLEKDSHQCQECGYEWEIKYIRSKSRAKSGGNRCCPDCGGKSCCDQ